MSGENIEVSSLMSAMPHRPPMVWVSRILKWEESERGLRAWCLIELDNSAHYFSSDGRPRPSSCIEWIAQSYGYASAAFERQSHPDARAERTYLVGVDRAQVDFSSWSSETAVLHVYVETLRVLPPLTFISGKVYVPNQEHKPLASADVKVYVESATEGE